MNMEVLAAVGIFVLFGISVLLLVWVVSQRAEARSALRRGVPEQRSALTENELIKLNQQYGAGQISDAEYNRRRKDLLRQA